MQHLTEEQLVSHYYHDDESATVHTHLRDCAECAAQYDTIRRVLALVTDAPVPERGDDYGDQVWNRLRWKLGSQRRRRATWISSAAAAAALGIAFFAGHFYRAVHEPVTPVIASHGQNTTAQPVAQSSAEQNDKILLLVVGDHFDDAERMLLEVANADPSRGLEIEKESARAGELVAANRIYRQTASQRGNERLAAVLSDLEPVLLEIAHSRNNLKKSELTELQKRIEAKGLIFKVRVISAQATATQSPQRSTINPNADSL